MVGKIRATLVELYSRVIQPDKGNNNIYLNGIDNLYPYEIERVINNSPTATRAVSVMHNFIAGGGVLNDRLVNPKKNYYLSDIVDLIASDISTQNGCFIWVGYGINEEGEIYRQKLDILDYSNSRISKEDDNEYPGKVYYKDYQKKKNFYNRNDSSETWYYPYNPNTEIVAEQMRADARRGLELKKDDPVTIEQMVRHYRGQVYYMNLTPRYKYALSKFDSVYNDADSEFRYSLYINKELRTGFMGKVIAIIKGDDENGTVKNDLGDLLGAENVGSLLVLEAEQTDEIDKVLKIEQLKPQVEDGLLEKEDKRMRRNILGAANNLPEPLIYAGEGAMFGTSGDVYREYKLFYQEQTQRERIAIEKTLKYLGFETNINPLVDEDVIEEQNGVTE